MGFEPHSVAGSALGPASRLLRRGPAPSHAPHEGGSPPSEPPYRGFNEDRLERAMGFEPTTASLEGWNSTTELRPPEYLRQHCRDLNPTRTAILLSVHITRYKPNVGGQARIRTLEDISQQIYSLPPLATWVPARSNFPHIRAAKPASNSANFFALFTPKN